MLLEHLGETEAARTLMARDRGGHRRPGAAHPRPRRHGHHRAGDRRGGPAHPGQPCGARRLDRSIGAFTEEALRCTHAILAAAAAGRHRVHRRTRCRTALPRQERHVLAGVSAGRRVGPVGAPPADRAEEKVPGDRHRDPVQGRRRRRAAVGHRPTRCRPTASNIVGINLPHMVLQPMEGIVQYKTDDVTPVFWFHYTPDALVVA